MTDKTHDYSFHPLEVDVERIPCAVAFIGVCYPCLEM
jgi:hypothetical protein